MRRTLLTMLLTAASLSAEKVEILRDDFWVAHIFASTPAGAAFASGYAQAEDRLEDLMRNYRKSQGTMAEAFGPEWYSHDVRQRRWAHARVAKEHYSELSPVVRSIIEGYCAGVNRYIDEHPGELPSWGFKIEPWQVVAYSRYTIWSWHEGDAAEDLERGGVTPDPLPYLGSNEVLIAPFRSAANAPLAIIDPHLSWYGETRYFEMRVYGGKLGYSGGTRLGLPFPTLGHSKYVSIAMTTGGPDTGDTFEEEIKDGKYKFKGEWLPLKVVHEKIGVKVADRVEWKDIAIEYTHHGPIWAHKDGKAYSMATLYAAEFRLLEQAWAMTTAKNLAEMKEALKMRQYMAQNIMVGTVDGDIFYIRNGRVPIRPKGCDPSRPQPGTGECEWLGMHPIEDLVQIQNPPQGYMQNCNISPIAMMKDSPLVPEKWAEHPYLYNDGRAQPHQRAAMMLELLDNARNVTLDDMVGIAFSTQVYKAEAWQERIRKADPGGAFAQLIAGWNRRSDADSRGALAFYLFKMALGKGSMDVEPPVTLGDEALRAALKTAEQRLKSDFAADAVFGTYFRVGREGAGRTFPVGGGSLRDAGMATPRAVSFRPVGKEMVGVGGQTSTQIVLLKKPVPESYMIIPLGQSDHKESGHFDDQAEKLFSKAKAKPTFFMNRKELEKHVTARRELVF
jgi:acyl-homoserine lactone acylase PvdQ